MKPRDVKNSPGQAPVGDVNRQAMIAVHSILLAGGTQAAAEAAAVAILTKQGGDKEANRRNRAKVEKEARRTAEMIASVALLSVRTAAVTPTSLAQQVKEANEALAASNRSRPARQKKYSSDLDISNLYQRSYESVFGTRDRSPSEISDKDGAVLGIEDDFALTSASDDSHRSSFYDLVRTTTTEDEALLFTTAKTRGALKGLQTNRMPGESTLFSSLDDEESQNYADRNCDEVSLVDSLLTMIEPREDMKIKRKKDYSACSIKIDETSWTVTGFKELEPRAGSPYFPFLFKRSTEHINKCAKSTLQPYARIISVCVPCFNEEAASLERSIKSLSCQVLPPGVRLEVVVAMDGTRQISKSMRQKLEELFGVSTKEGAANNPFELLRDANTIIVETTQEPLHRDPSHVKLSLVLKRENKRKVNSQMWWLRGHARDSRCEFAFATDCGIVFDRKCISIMLERMDRQPNLSALTGYQRVMTAKMQGDSRFELVVDPMGFFLRLLQAYDFELSQSTTKSALDSIGFLSVLPGPCSLFRFKHFIGVTHEYLSLTTKRSKQGSNISRIVLGNVQLAEDRFPPVLLTFRSKEDCIEAGISRPRVGFEHDAVFYFEAEKPLGQLVKQRRRWINGAYIAVCWVLKESWISNADHSLITKSAAFVMLLIEFLQGIAIRLFVPGTIACGIIFMCTIIPPIYTEDSDSIVTVLNDFTKADQNHYWIGCGAGAFYLFVYALFMILHVPRAIAHKHRGQTVWKNDTSSAYRPWLFFVAFLLNAIVVGMFVYVGIGVYRTVGWSGAPGYLQALSAMSTLPYVVAFADGIVNSKYPSFRTIFNLLWMSPVYFISALWFYVWFPAYATARISDLSWGNREGSHQEETSNYVALSRSYYGRLATFTLIFFNTLIAGLAAGVVYAIPSFLTAVLFTLLAFNVLLHALNLFDMLIRLVMKIWVCIIGVPPEDPNAHHRKVSGGDAAMLTDEDSD